MPDLGIYLPLIALATFVIALFARDGVTQGGEGRMKISGNDAASFVIFAFLIAVLVFFHLKWRDFQNGLPGILAAFVAGGFAAAIAYRFGRDGWQVNAGRAAPMALAALTACGLELLASNAPLAAVFGAALVAWIAGMKNVGNGAEWAMRTSFFILCAYAADTLGAMLPSPAHGLGSMLALAAAISTILGLGIGEAVSKKSPLMKFSGPVLSVLLFVLGGFLLFRKDSVANGALVVLAVASVLALLAAWVIGGEGADTARVIVAGVLWLAVATAAFGYTKTLGMALALGAACFVTVIFGQERALLAIGPLAALVIYRIFRVLHPETAEAFDIAQHYALIGFMLGVMIPALAIEWRKAAFGLESGRSWTAGSLWLFLLVAAPVPIAVALSEKGIVGYMVGLGFAPILEALRGERRSGSFSLALGLSCAMVFVYGWIEPYLDLDRQGKIRALAWVLSIMALAAIGIGALSRRNLQVAAA